MFLLNSIKNIIKYDIIFNNHKNQSQQQKQYQKKILTTYSLQLLKMHTKQAIFMHYITSIVFI